MDNNQSFHFSDEGSVCFLGKCPDPTTMNWPLLSDYWPTFLMSLLYVVGCVWIGPALMKNRKPMELKQLCLAYNAFQIVFSFYMCHEVTTAGWFKSYKLFCEPVSTKQDIDTIRVQTVSWLFFISKFTEFIDTILFICRKKFSHVTALHVIHHGIMPTAAFLCAKYTPTGHSTFTIMLNTFIHFIMYSYYFLAALGPQYQKYIWWKKYLTILQMGQFLLCGLHSISILFDSSCTYPRVAPYGVISLSVLFFILFANFFIQDGKRRREKSQAQAKNK